MFVDQRILPRRCGLIIGHPGHELSVFGWLRAAKPVVAVLTDGGGHCGASRLDLTRSVLESAGAEASRCYGLISDQEMYRAILQRDAPLFQSLSEQLADLLIERAVDCVAGDAIEGYNPSHDLCRLMIDRAVHLAQLRGGRRIQNYAFSLVGPPASGAVSSGQWRITLSPSELGEKIAESRRYAKAAGSMLEAEVEHMLQNFGEAAFADEVLYPMETAAALARFRQDTPFYETHGATQVAAGHYAQIIRFREHVAPLADALAVGA